MASTLVNNFSLAPEPFSASAFSSFGWLSPRVSFGRDEEKPPSKSSLPSVAVQSPTKDGDGDSSPVFDFEFRLHDPVTMLPADELFSDGKLVPLHLASIRANTTTTAPDLGPTGFRTPDPPQKTNRSEVVASIESYVFSPKAPRCSSRWRVLLGLKKAASAAKPDHNSPKQTSTTTTSIATPTSHPNTSTRGGGGGLKHLIHRSNKSSLNLPLLRGGESEPESVSISARLSLSSSSSSGREQEDLPRLSLDSDRSRNPPRLRVSKLQQQQRAVQDHNHPSRRGGGGGGCKSKSRVMIPPNGASVESPRMNSYGKIDFQGLERSSSSPSTFNGGPRAKRRGMERSYSANVRVTPVLNVPVCSLRGSAKNVFGLGQLFSSQQKKDGSITGRPGGGGGRGHRQTKETVTGGNEVRYW